MARLPRTWGEGCGLAAYMHRMIDCQLFGRSLKKFNSATNRFGYDDLWIGLIDLSER
jgi:hypothetical protein